MALLSSRNPPGDTGAAVQAAISSRYRHIDTAAAYGNEREVGKAALLLSQLVIRQDLGIEIHL